MTDPVDDFVDLLRRLDPSMKVALDRAQNPTADVFIDLSAPGFATTISFSARSGFGFFDVGAGYGERPQRIVPSAKEAARIAASLRPGLASGDTRATPPASRRGAA